MAEEKSSVNLLLISSDMEWLHTFDKGAQKFFYINKRTVDSLSAVEDTLDNGFEPNLVILGLLQGMPQTTEIAQLLAKKQVKAPLLVITTQQEPSDNYIKQGASFVLARRDLLSALKLLQSLVNFGGSGAGGGGSSEELDATKALYDRLFLDIPDPICYLQDGLFLDANPAFLRKFKLAGKAALDENTMMNFIPIKSDRAFKQLMKMIKEKDVVPSEKMFLTDSEGAEHEMTAQVAKVLFKGEEAIQLYLRDNTAGASSGIDETTGLASELILKSSVYQNQEKTELEVMGSFVYFWVENYREVMQKDGYENAEILIKSVVDTCKRFLPVSTELARFKDDAILMWINEEKEASIERINNLVKALDEVVPEDIGRLIHPHCFAGMLELRKNSIFEELISDGNRAVKRMALANTNERVSEPAPANMSRKDERNLKYLNKMIEKNLVHYLYQPIIGLKADGIARYCEVFSLLKDPDANPEDERNLENDTIIQLANRFGLGKFLDQIKIRQFCEDYLSYEGDQKTLFGYLTVGDDSVSDESFTKWLPQQLKNVGLPAKQLVLNFSFDTVNNQFTNIEKLITTMKPVGTKFSISGIGRYDDVVAEVLERIKPDFIKLDMSEIDTFDEQEESYFMTKIKEFVSANNTTVVVENMDTTAQLSRVYPYDLNYLQGDGMIPASEGFQFDFSEQIF